jgi:hypothetical protein
MKRVVVVAIVIAACGCGSSDDIASLETATADAGSVDSADASGAHDVTPEAPSDVAQDASASSSSDDGDAGSVGDTDRAEVLDASRDESDTDSMMKPPSTADNPPVPAGYKLMMQSEITAEMTDWAVSILHDPTGYPMFATATKTFGAVTVLLRVEWHPPDFTNNEVHRGVTLYEPV